MIYTLENYDEAYEFVTTHEGYEIIDLGNKTYKVAKKATPEQTIEEQNEAIRQERQRQYVEISDPLKMDYDEALARGEATADEKKQAWLSSKDKIREENPYIEVK